MFIVFTLWLLQALPIVQGIQREPAGSMATCLIPSGSSRVRGYDTLIGRVKPIRFPRIITVIHSRLVRFAVAGSNRPTRKNTTGGMSSHEGKGYEGLQ